MRKIVFYILVCLLAVGMAAAQAAPATQPSGSRPATPATQPDRNPSSADQPAAQPGNSPSSAQTPASQGQGSSAQPPRSDQSAPAAANPDQAPNPDNTQPREVRSGTSWWWWVLGAIAVVIVVFALFGSRNREERVERIDRLERDDRVQEIRRDEIRRDDDDIRRIG